MYDSRGERRLRFDPLFTRPATRSAQHALATLREHLEARAVGVVLEPGDLLLVDNRRAVHARTAFSPRYDGTDRWIQRLLVLQGQVPVRIADARDPWDPYMLRM